MLLLLLLLLFVCISSQLVAFSMLRIMLAIMCVFCEFYFYRLAGVAAGRRGEGEGGGGARERGRGTRKGGGGGS